ncbi:DNA-binding CsgD family transcriptional regulator [Maritimibacter alkaliphilus HTCC2654]|uniref:Transcriptional regulatory protein n=1 Tax=Maritimibacter alkaliphilus HTCC2654 TaxID=314271 RepID=A3VED5_9RHOB|nr:transcriptional regulator [Maritimibacter alkaliphilus]EAQ13273.1 transcriptional regulatory protein [Rhodobacterales bacterium HTCC2654] [Maritimibacter alkaliphilus HTCC2654]TYP85305.1 DNA-binding CsgD family transcriptional regulator [Maritimibacter alkaliphilus HTCC2654]
MDSDVTQGVNPIHAIHGIKSFGDDPPPPYQINVRDFLFIRAEFERDAVRAAVPEELEISDENTGFIGMTTSTGGWGLEPYSLVYIALDVKNAASADGTPRLFRAFNYYSGQPARLFRRHYNRRMQIGYCNQWNEGLTWYGEAGRDEPEVRLTMRRTTEDFPDPVSGIHHYISDAPEGGLAHFYVTYTGRFAPAELIDYEVLPAASDMLKMLKPTGFPFVNYGPSGPLAISEPHPFDPTAGAPDTEAHQLGLMDIISRIGLAAALVSRDGRLLFLNERARSMLAMPQVGGRLITWRKEDQRHLDAEIVRAGQAGSLVSDIVALVRPDSTVPIVARALPVSRAMAGEPAFLVLFTEPDARVSEEADKVLQVLGLTPAEARLAAGIGAGRSVGDCADYLGVTNNTARSTLKVVYDKLGISKQTELAGIVARLG